MTDHDGYVLFDRPGGGTPVDHEFLEQIGHRVMVCGGPTADAPCPILDGGHCELAENAEAVVFEFDLDRDDHRAILSRYKEVLREDMPLRVVLKPGQAERYPELISGLGVWSHEPVAGDLDAIAAEAEAADR